MKILTFKEFLETPKETVFSYYRPQVFDGLMIKCSDIADNDHDFLYDDIIGAIENDSSADYWDKCEAMSELKESMPMDFECTGREGLYDRDQLYAVYEKEDVVALIERLQRTVSK